MPPQQKKPETKKAEDKKPEVTETSTSSDDSFAEELESEINELFKDVEELSEEDKNSFLLYLASRITKYGFAVIKINVNVEDVKSFNSAQLFNDVGSSKNLRLDTLKQMQEARKYKRDPMLVGDSTPTELAKAILDRAGLPDTIQKDDLVKFFARALVLNIPDPILWQNPLWKRDE